MLPSERATLSLGRIFSIFSMQTIRKNLSRDISPSSEAPGGSSRRRCLRGLRQGWGHNLSGGKHQFHSRSFASSGIHTIFRSRTFRRRSPSSRVSRTTTRGDRRDARRGSGIEASLPGFLEVLEAENAGEGRSPLDRLLTLTTIVLDIVHTAKKFSSARREEKFEDSGRRRRRRRFLSISPITRSLGYPRFPTDQPASSP